MTTSRITAVDRVEAATPSRPGDDTVFIVVRTAAGDGWYGPVSSTIASCVHTMLGSAAIGLDAADPEATHTLRERVSMGRPDASMSWALGSIDCALWDLRGKLARLPVAGLLSGNPASTVPAYASWLTRDLADRRHAQLITRINNSDWSFAKWGLRAHTRATAPREAARIAQSITRCTKAGARVAVDARGSWGTETTAALASLINPSTLLWAEDPLDGHDLAAYRQLSRTSMPLALCERLVLGEDAEALLDAARPVALILDAVGCGGLSEAVDIIALARQHGVPVYPHGRSLVPGMHLAAAFPETVRAVEFRLQWEPARQRRLAHPHLPRGGHLEVPQEPGLSTIPRRLR